MKHAEKVKLGISIGDLNGIGSEIVLKTFDDSRMLDFCTPIIFASTKVLTFLKKQFNLSLNYQGIEYHSWLTNENSNLSLISQMFFNNKRVIYGLKSSKYKLHHGQIVPNNFGTKGDAKTNRY